MAHLLALCLYFPSLKCSVSSRDRAADEHQLLSVSVPVGAARAAALWREPASYEPGRGKHHVVTHLYD